MKPEQIVTGLEWSRQLKEAGFPQKGTVFAWNEKPEPWGWELVQMWHEHNDEWEYHIAAPTAEEVLRRLPKQWIYEDRQGARCVQLIVFTRKRGWRVEYNGPLYNVGFNDQSLANAAAAMYCHLAGRNLLPQQ